MRAVLKYTLKDDEVQRVMMPMYADIVAVQAQENRVTLWAIVDSWCGAWTGNPHAGHAQRCNLRHDHNEVHSFDPDRREPPIADLPTEERVFRLAMTGQPHSSNDDLLEYLGTVQLVGVGGPWGTQPLVVHVFEETEEGP
jgi:hypothetical protein